MNQTISDELIKTTAAQYFIEDFLVIGPDVSELKKKREVNKGE